MKIAFLEYYHKYRNTGDFNFMNAWYKLLSKRHKVDWVQIADLDDDQGLDAKTIHQVDLLSYDAYVTCDLYESRKKYLADKLSYKLPLLLENLTAEGKNTIFMCHQRTFPNDQDSTTFDRMTQLAMKCSRIFAYVPEHFKDLGIPVERITAKMFYKPIENKELYSHLRTPIDLLFINNLCTWKNPLQFLDLCEKVKDSLPEQHMYGYYRGIDPNDKENYNNVIRNDDRVFYYPINTDKVKLFDRIESRKEVCELYYLSKFSWQWTKPIDGSECEEPWGLEGSALESILYGCVPILPKSSENYIVGGRELKQYECCVFLEDMEHLEPLYEAIENYQKYYNRLSLIQEFLKNERGYLDHITYKLQGVE